MKKNFEELAVLDHDVIVQKSHIVHSTLDDVINKRFNKFNPVKAKGIANALERDFNIDMSGWLQEYDGFKNNKVEAVSTIERAAKEAIEESKVPKKKMMTIVGSVVGFVAFLYIMITYNPLASLIGEQNMTDAEYKSEINKTEEANATNIALENADNNGSLPSVMMPLDANATKAAEANKSVTTPPPVAPQPVANHAAVNQTVAKPLPAPVASQPTNKLVIECTKKLWYRVIYLDNNKTEEMTMEPGHTEIDGSRPKILILGHQQNKIVFGQTTIESKSGAKIRYLMKDKKLTQISEEEEYKLQGKTMPKPKTEN